MSRPDRLASAVAAGALSLPETGTIAVLRAEPSELFDLAEPSRFLCEQTFRPVHDALAQRGLPVTTRVTAPVAMAIVNATRQRAETLGNLARALILVPAGGIVVLNGAKTDGIDSLVRRVAGALQLGGTFVKAHGRVAWLERPANLPPEVTAWASEASPRLNAEGFVTAPGMFSPEAADPGSQRLAGSLDGRIKGRVADLGAGWGWLAARALEACPGIVGIDLYEAEGLALDAARQNVTDPRAAFHWSDVRALRRGDGPFDWAIANPPFHQGRAAEPELAAAARILRPGGRFLMVANRQLPYEAPLAAAFRTVERLSEDTRFKVLGASHPLRR
jgi:16S rRNA (guanine1207-N2)-methyltransferase